MKGVVYIGLSFGVKMVCALIVLRMLTEHLGQEGFGYITQYMAFLAIVFGLTLGGASNYLINKLSNSSSVAESEKEISIVFTYGLLFFIVLTVVIICFLDQIESYVLFAKVQWYFVPYCMILFFISNVYSCLLALAMAQKKLKLFAIVNVMGAITYVFFMFVVVQYAGVENLLWVMPLSYVLPIIFMLNSFPERIQINFHYILHVREFSEVFKYCFIVYAGLVSLPFVGILVRNQFLGHFSAVDLSYWQAAVKLSDTMQQFYGVFCSAILLPYFSRELRRLSFKRWRYSLLCLSAVYIGIGLILFFSRDIVVRILFGAGYEQSQRYIPYYLVGDYFRGIALFCSFTLISCGRYRAALFLEVAQGLLFYGTYSLLHGFGSVEAVGGAYIFTYIICALIMYLFVFSFFKGREIENTYAV